MDWLRIGAVEAQLDARSINAIIRKHIDKKAQTVTKDPALRKELGEVMIKLATPYVPMKTGKLRNHAYATKDGRLIWDAHSPKGFDYASQQYYHLYKHYTTPNTGPYWVDQVNYSVFIQEILPLLKERFSDE